jgi:aspartate-semialdehyde dehydrogenase
MKKRQVAILGATGLVGRHLTRILADHPTFELAMLVGSEATAGQRYGEVWRRKEEALHEHYGAMWTASRCPEKFADAPIKGFDDLLKSDIPIVFSSLAAKVGAMEQALVDGGCTVFSNSPYARFDVDVPLVVPEFNHQIMGSSRLIKNPNCVTNGLILALSPIHALYGVDSITLITYQSVSGRGDQKYSRELITNNVLPLRYGEEKAEILIHGEIRKFLGPEVRSSVTCNRVFVAEGHLAEVRLKTKRPITSEDELLTSWREFNPLASMRLPSSPARPILISREPGRPRPKDDAQHGQGMAIMVGNIDTKDEIYDLSFSFVVNNLIRGAGGGAVLNAEAWHARG